MSRDEGERRAMVSAWFTPIDKISVSTQQEFVPMTDEQRDRVREQVTTVRRGLSKTLTFSPLSRPDREEQGANE